MRHFTGHHQIAIVPSTAYFIKAGCYYHLMQSISHILDALLKVRIDRYMDETSIHEEIMKIFDQENIQYEHEYKLIPHKRFDFWMDGIVIEVKKKKPSKITLLNQLNRYTKADEVKAIIVALEKSMTLPKELNNKPIFVISLNANWGVAI